MREHAAQDPPALSLRAAAKAAYEKALELDPANEIVQNALRGLETEQPNPAAR